MKRTIRKRILSGLLAVMMIVSNVNVSTYAAEDGQIVHEQELEADPENAGGNQAEEVTENTDAADEGQNDDDALQEQNDSESAESKDTDAAESKESEKETETQDQSEAETSAASTENASTEETSDTKTPSSADSKNESSAAETQDSSKDKQSNAGDAGSSGLSTGESTALTTESTTSAESQTSLAETLAEETDSSPVNLSAQDTVKIRYSVNKWWILCEKELSTDAAAEGDELDFSTATEEYKQSVTGTRKRKELLTDSENTIESTAAEAVTESGAQTEALTESKSEAQTEAELQKESATESASETKAESEAQTAAQAFEKENAVETANANTAESSASATESTENSTSAADTESTSESETSKDSEKNQFVEVYNFGQYNYAPSMTMGFDVSFSLNKKYSVKKETENSETGKTVTETVSREVKASDYLTFTLPKELANLSIELPEDAYYTYETEALDSGETKVTVTLGENVPDTENLTGKLHLTFTIDNEVLEAGEGTCEIVLFGKTYQLVFSGENTIAETAATEYFEIAGSIDFDEQLGAINWKDIVRPSVFSLPIQLIQHYTNDAGVDRTNTITTQENNSSADCYLKFANDGKGGGDFTITNVPKSVTVKETTDGETTNKPYKVISYDVKVDTEKLPYYSNAAASTEVITDDTSQAIVTLKLTLNSQNLTLKPTVSPADESDNTGFQFNVSFTNSMQLDGKAVSSKTIEKKYIVTAGQSQQIAVPLNISYSVTQTAAEGYRLDSKYAVSDGVTTNSQENKGTGTICRDSAVTTTNYNQNKTYPFLVYWVDNANKNRPSVSAENFQLQYRTTSSDIPAGEWTDLTDDTYANLNIDSAPTYDASTAQADNKYYYKKLPSADKNGKAVEYRVVPVAPDGYVATTSTDDDGTEVITFEEQLDFEATIYWNDRDYSKDRPSVERASAEKQFKLYRRTGTSDNYVLVTDCNLTIEDVSGTGALDFWSVKAENLPRYDADNNEYDYVLVQGSIGDGNEITAENFESYKAHYNNAKGTYGNDTSLCHNGGYITEVLQATTRFNATKVWKDSDSDAGNRPTATVTLWRYSKGTADNIDEAYANGKAAQVIFLTYNTDEEGKQITTEHIASEQLKGDTIENISSDHLGGYHLNLSKYDDQGREYVYFVRETLSGDKKDEYETHYSVETTDAEGNVTTTTYKNGAPTGGTITNVRRKKEAVTVTKIWKNPSGLSGIDGISVQAEIQASADDGQTYDTLTVYSDTQNSYTELTGEDKVKAQTISGFTSTIAQSEKTYYVNTYNSEGKLYDMTNARIVETVIGRDGKTKWTSSSSDIEKGDTSTKLVTDASGNQYSVSTKYTETSTLAGGMKQYRYTQTNTITATRDYTLIKVWDRSISDAEFQDISSIKFTLYRRSTKDSADGTQASYSEVKSDEEDGKWIVPAGNGRNWTLIIQKLPKYDEEGYEYYYKADEVSFIKNDGSILTVTEARMKPEDSTNGRNWSQNYYRTPDQTKVVNHIPSPGGGYFTASKIWRDNGDSDKRGDVVLRVYSKEQLKAALASASDIYTSGDTIVNLDSLQYNGSKLKYYEATLKKSDQYTAYITFAKIDEALGISANTSDSNISSSTGTSSNRSLKDYVVFEYEVKDAGVVSRIVNAVKAVLSAMAGSENTNGAEYTYAQLYDAANSDGSYSLSGTVSNSDRQYNTTATANTGDNTLMITNTRTGITSLDVKKTWEDDGNRENRRAAKIQFQLYRDGSPYTGIPDTVIASASNITKDGQTFASCRVALNHDSGVITVSAADGTENTAAEWSFTVKNLDMFSETAVPYIYNMDELAAESTSTKETTSNRQFSYTQKKQNVTSVDDGKTQTFSFGFVNTISGTTDHVAYKYWKDASIGAGNRPDLYLRLYRCLRADYDAAVKAAGGSSSTENADETFGAGEAQPSVDIKKLNSYEEYKDYKDLLWTREDDNKKNGVTDYEKGYNWRITVEDLPMFDEKGHEYIYFFTETMNNNGETVLGTYSASAVTKKLSNGNTYEVFTNTVTDEMRVTGRKTWSGLSNYQTTELPDPVITLYRTTASDIVNLQGKTDAEIKSLEENGSITEVDKTFLTGSTGSAEENDKTVYAFPNTTGLDPETQETVTDDKLEKKITEGLFCRDAGGNYMLPKFDSEGNRYTYLVRETISDTVASQLYNEINVNGTLLNKFRETVNRRKITVTKNWNRTQVSTENNEQQYPSVTFTLYRYEAGKDDTTAVKIANHTINSNEFKSEDGTQKSASYTFDDLLVYSPTGAQYFYYITEDKINGYEVKYTDEDGIANGTLKSTEVHAGTKKDGTPNTVAITDEMLDGLKNNGRIDVISLPNGWADENASEEDLVTAVSTTNTYVKTGKISISGSKVWNDYHNFAGLRPASASDIGLQVTLTRSTGNESGQSNKVNKTEVALKQLAAENKDEKDPYIVWDYGVNESKGITAKNSDKWTYTIYNLPKYAANGMAYTYTLSESALVAGYAEKASASADAGSANESGNVSSRDMVNRYSGSYTVRKNWYDGGNKYGLRPTDVTIVLQRASSSNLNANASDDSWSEFDNIPLEENQVGHKTKDKSGNDVSGNSWTDGYPSVVTENGKKIISVHLTAADVAANTNGNTWQYTFTNLPTIGKDSNGNTVKYKYQCIETQIGGIDVKTSYDVSSAGAYTRQYESPKESEKDTKTIIGNTLSSKTELTVSKQWDGDQDDYYYSRPTEISFKLQKKSNKSGSTWTDVQVTSSDGKETAYIFTIGKTDGWTKTLTDLPGIEVEESTGGNGETVHKQYAISYRAVELHTEKQSATNILKTIAAALTGTESTVVDGAQNYEDITSYSNIPSDGSSTGSDAAYESQEQPITNRLRVDDTHGSISVTKKWYTTSDKPQTAVFELLYKKANDDADTWHCYADKAVPASDDGDWSEHAQSETAENSDTESADKQCRVKTITATPEKCDESMVDYYAEVTCTWSNLPKYDRDGNALTYKVVEHPVDGYTTYSTATKTNESDLYATSYTFTNVENQSYSVKKVWDIPKDAVSYAEKSAYKNQSGKFTAIFKLQMKTENATTWTNVTSTNAGSKVSVENAGKTGYKDITLTNVKADVVSDQGAPKTGTWLNLPKYDKDGNQLIYRAVETKINNIDVENDTNGAYVASYKYGSGADTDGAKNGFGDTMTTVTNRMVYGFVNLAKKAAYLADGGITADTGNGSLQGVKFNIYSGTNPAADATPYASNVETDENGNLKNNGGKYGTEQKYLVAGTYTLKEVSSTTGTGYSVWANGISFTVGSGGSYADLTPQTLGKTGEHGTAWISTSGVGSFVLGLNVQYKAAADVTRAAVSTHSLNDGCVPSEMSDAAYDLESRGVIGFTKVGEKSTNSEDAYNDLDVHSDATGENAAYFGVYLDEACTQQVAGMVPKATHMAESEKPGADDWRTMVLTNKTLDGAELTVYKTVTLDTNGAASISSASDVSSSNDGSSKTYKIPYLRSNWVTNTDVSNDIAKNYPYTLLAGTYYIKELRAPAGYRLDTTVRKVTVDELKNVKADGTTDLEMSYVNNKAKLSVVGSTAAASDAYKWSNNPTVVTLYKLDQFGQKASLATDGYLTLTISGTGNDGNNAAAGDSNGSGNNTFPNGAATIRLYQSSRTPVKWFGSDAKEISNATNNYITYDESSGSWTIKGLLDAGKTYTLAEPADSVDEDHNIAKSITFSVNTDGTISVQNADKENATIVASESPLTANGTDADQMNCFKSDAADNQIVMRDTTNYRKDLVLQKEDSETNEAIANIYFKLYKYTNVDENGEPTNAVDVLGKDDGNEIYLKTDGNGKIQLSTLDASIKNQTITDPKNAAEKLSLKYGLEVGKYYLQEVEGGASDQYKLADKLYFEIKKNADKTAVNSYNEYATVVLTGSTANDSSHVSVKTEANVNNGVTTITLKNDPVHNKTLVLTKVDSDDTNKKLAGAKFTLSYVSANNGHAGAAEKWTKNCITGNDGLLYLEDTEGAAMTTQPDISAKGTYTLKETKAAAGYMTRAEKNGLTVLTFKVDTNNQITDVECYDAETGRLIDAKSADGMVTAEVENSTEEGQTSEHKNLKVTVKNERTKVSAQIFSDITKSNATKSCDQKDLTGEDLYGTHLEIYKGTASDTEAAENRVAVLSGDKQNGWSWKDVSGTTGDETYLPAGTLKENTIYTLHESGAPIGYMAGKDIYFALSGTTTQKNTEGKDETVSQLYVWTGDGTPNADDAVDANLAVASKWSKLTNVKDNVLTMVDEAIIAPVDLQKVLASVDSGSFKALAGAEFEVALRNTAAEGTEASTTESKTVLGTAVTTEKGYLVWKSITEAGFAYGRIFNAEGTRVSATNKDTAIGKTIVLQQNAEGYVFTETKAPDTAYNDGLSFHVQITKENYLEYRTVAGTGEAKTLTYHTDKYIDLVEAEKNTKSNIPYSVKEEAERSGKTEYTDADALAVNREYQSVVTLHKYDASAEGQKAAIAGTEFTLYRDSVSKDNIYKKAYIVEKEGDDRKTTLNKSGVFTTDADGNITIEIREKGTYILKETKASAGYVLDDANLLTFVLQDEAETQSLTVNGNSAPVYGYGTTANVLKKDENGVPNLREEVPVTPTEPETQPETEPETKPENKGTSSGSHGGGSGGGSSVSSMHAVITATEAESQTAAETVAETAAESVGSGSSGGTSGGEAAEYDPDGDVKNARRNKNRNGKYGKNGKKTGDTQKPVIWISLICGAAALVGGVEFFDRRKRRKKDDTK